MNSLSLPSHLLCPLSSRNSAACFTLKNRFFKFNRVSRARQISISATLTSDEESVPVAIPVMKFEDVNEKDWSFLDSVELNSNEDNRRNIDRIIKAGDLERSSRVLVSIGCEEFVDRLVDSQLLLVVHDSLFVLACLKEKYDDDIKCWQGEIIYVPEKWAPFDVVFLYFVPGLPFQLDQVFETLAKRCLSGAKVVISHLGGREALEQQKKQFPDIVVSELPDEKTLRDLAANHSLEMVEFVDESGFYLAVLKFS